MNQTGITKNISHECFCDCGEFVKVHQYKRRNGGGHTYLVCDFIQGHNRRGKGGFDPSIHASRFCLCSCGLPTRKVRGRYNRFLEGHENIGRVSWNKGRFFSEAVRHKMSLARLGKEPANKAKINLEKLRNSYVQEKKNISAVSRELGVSIDALKNRLRALGWSRSTKESCSTEAFRKQMRHIRITALTSQKIIETPNKLEKKVYESLDQLGIPYQKQVPLFGKFVVDAFFPQKRLVLEIFGRYWHEMPKIKQKDMSKKRYLQKCGYAVEELWDDEIKKKGANVLLGEISKKYELV